MAIFFDSDGSPMNSYGHEKNIPAMAMVMCHSYVATSTEGNWGFLLKYGVVGKAMP